MTDWLGWSKKLPLRPGVYLFHDADGAVVYVGKAVNLRSRVSSYFRASSDLQPAKRIMVDTIRRLEHIIVRSETEALLLESTLIKKYRPKYNILLKDDKFFQYIKINLRERFPQVATVRRVTIDGSRYFGPYTSGLAVRRTMRLLKRLFPYKSCDRPPERPCFDWQLGRCLGHDTEPGSEQRYQDIVRHLIAFLEGRTGNTLSTLKKQMVVAAKRRDFETAAICRDRWQALTHIIEKQAVVSPRRDSYDVVGLARHEDLAAIALFQVRQGKLVQQDQFILQHTGDQADAAVVSAFISQYYAQSTVHPRLIVTPVTVPVAVTNAYQLTVRVASRGTKKRLVSLATENAADHLHRDRERWLTAETKARLGLNELAHAIKLPGPPQRIEMYDISNYQGRHAVGSMVVFEHGQPKSSAYRKFIIREVVGPDDTHMLAEVIRRRFARHDGTGWPLPDLLMLDGGKAQLSVVLKNVPGLGEHVPVVALAKEHEELFLPGQSRPIRLPPGSQELFLIQRIRDEAHRYAIGFSRQRLRRETLRSVLDDIPGIGPKIRRQLRTRYATAAAIAQASDQELTQSIGPRLTRVIRRYL